MKLKFQGDRGTAIVEFAIVLPLLILLLVGFIEFSLILYDKAVMTNASREGARAGIVAQSPKVSDASIRGVVKNYCRTYLLTFGSDTIEDGDIAIAPGSPRDSLPFGTDLTVTLTYRYDFLALPKFMSASLGPINLVARTTMRME